jgi:hypothetical protein
MASFRYLASGGSTAGWGISGPRGLELSIGDNYRNLSQNPSRTIIPSHSPKISAVARCLIHDENLIFWEIAGYLARTYV